MKNLMKSIILLACFWGSAVYAQIEISEDTQPKKRDIQILQAEESTTEVYFLSNFSTTNRTLKENEGLFGDTLGIRADETKLNKWSFGVGLRNRIGKHFGWEGGISYIQNGESYMFEGIDSTFQYETTYSYIAMPLKFSFLHGNNVQFIASAGVIPQMFLGYRQEQKWTTPLNAKEDDLIKLKSGFNSFVISAVFDAGVKLKFSKSWSLLIVPEYRLQLNSTYEKNDSFIHKASALGVNLGLTLAL